MSMRVVRKNIRETIDGVEVIKDEFHVDGVDSLTHMPGNAVWSTNWRDVAAMLRGMTVRMNGERNARTWCEINIPQDDGTEIPATVDVEEVGTIRKYWAPSKTKSADGTLAAKRGFNEPAAIVANLIVGTFGILVDPANPTGHGVNLDSDKQDDWIDGDFFPLHLYSIVNPMNRYEYYRTLHLEDGDLHTILSVMNLVRGVKHVLRNTIAINGKAYSFANESVKPVTLDDSQIPLYDLHDSGETTAQREIQPIIGERGFNLLCMAFYYSLIAPPRGYFVLSDDGGTGKSSLLGSFVRVFRNMCASVNLRRLTSSDDFARGSEFEKLAGGKTIMFAEEGGKLDGTVSPVLNEVSTGSVQTARSHSWKRDFWCQAWIFIATNSPDKLPKVDNVERRRVTITLRKSSAEEWSRKFTYHGKSITHGAFANTMQCIIEMVCHGCGLVLAAQANAKDGHGMNVFDGLSMDDVPTAENALDLDDPEIANLVDLILSNPEAQPFLRGEAESVRTTIPTSGLLPSMSGAHSFFEKFGIDESSYRPRQKDGTRPRMLKLVDLDKMRPLLETSPKWKEMGIPASVPAPAAVPASRPGVSKPNAAGNAASVVAPRIPIMPYKDVKEALYGEENSEVALSRAGSIVGNQLNRYLAPYGKHVEVTCEYAPHDITPDELHPTRLWSKETLTILMDGRPYANLAIQLPGEGDTPHGVDIVTMPGGVVTLANGDGSIHGMNDVAMSIARGETIGTCAKYDQTFVNSDEE